jgi:hypothetical protein
MYFDRQEPAASAFMTEQSTWAPLTSLGATCSVGMKNAPERERSGHDADVTRDRAVRNTRTSSKARRLGDKRTKRLAFRNNRQLVEEEQNIAY